MAYTNAIATKTNDMSILLPDNRYTTRLNYALSFAHANICKNIQLDQLADSACMSKYHFSRIFQDQVGESPMRFLRRIRLEKAACLLSNLRHVPVVDIATECGFSSSQLFTRVFGDYFGFCPSQFRSNHVFSMEHKRGHENIDLRYKEFQAIGIDRDSPSTHPQIKIAKLSPIKVAYVRSFGKYHGGSTSMKAAVDSILAWSRANRMRTPQTEFIGVSWDYSSITPESMCRFDACVALHDHYLPDSGMSCQTIPGGYYAVIEVLYEPRENHRLFWKWFFLTLYTSSHFQKFAVQISSGPWLEVYKPNKKEGKNVVEFYVYLNQ